MKVKFLILYVFFLFSQAINSQIAVVGCGYVGLTLTTLLSKSNLPIYCIDINEKCINDLKNGILSIYEPKLSEYLFNPANEIIFSTDVSEASKSDIFFICVATPIDKYGNPNHSILHCAFEDVLSLFSTFKSIVDRSTRSGAKIVCIKSTVPPGTIRKFQDYLVEQNKTNIHLIYNPEFMREGSALTDMLSNPIVLGSESTEAMKLIEALYKELLPNNVEIVKTNLETAEMIKYAWNAFQAIRISYINELADLCNAFNADIATLIKGFSLSEKAVPTSLMKPGPGFGGSCLPKDTTAFTKVMEKKGIYSSMVHQAIYSNEQHKKKIIQYIFDKIGPIKENKIVSLLGLSFKANTDDIRYAQSIDIIAALLDQGVTIQAYDPKAMPGMQKLFPSVCYTKSPYKAVEKSNCIVLLTEWDEFKSMDLSKLASLCSQKTIIDTRNLFNPSSLKKLGFDYINMGLL